LARAVPWRQITQILGRSYLQTLQAVAGAGRYFEEALRIENQIEARPAKFHVTPRWWHGGWRRTADARRVMPLRKESYLRLSLAALQGCPEGRRVALVSMTAHE